MRDSTYVQTNRLEKERVRAAADGHWHEILTVLGGIPPDILDGKPHPCPRCGGRNRFSAFPEFEQTGAVLCRGCFHEKNGDGFATLFWLRDWPFPQAVAEVGQFLGLTPDNGTNHVPPTTTHHPPPREKPAPTVARAIGKSKTDWQPLWNQAKPATEADVGLYFVSRGLTFAPHEDCRFTPDAKAKLEDGSWHEGPAMLWLVRNPDGEPVAVHRTFLSADCRSKASIDGCKRLLGKPGPGAAIRLIPADGDTLVVCEGVETSLSIVQATSYPVWSLTSSSAFAKFTTPDNVRTLVIAADHDETGLKTARGMAKRLQSKDLEVLIAKPPEGQDANDLLVAEGAEAVASVIASATPWKPPEVVPEEGESEVPGEGNSEPRIGSVPNYATCDGRLCRIRFAAEKENFQKSIEPLGNFTAQITKEIIRDDGAERAISLTIEGRMDNGTPLPPIDVPSRDFVKLEWLGDWGAGPTVFPPNRNFSEIRAAIRLLSDPTRETRFAMTGWQDLGGVWHYLHAGGAIGPNGARHDVTVELPGALARIRLPDPPTRKEDASIVRQTLDAWRRLSTDDITLPVLATVFRAPLGPTPFITWLFGSTGTRKSCVAGLAQAFSGAEFDHGNLPANWSNTPTATEHAQFSARDCLLVVDDFRPTHGRNDRERQEALAERVIRSQGNLAARQRCGSDATLRPPKDPRCTMLSTGEELPATPSLQARLFTLELKPGSIDLPALTECQRLAREGVFASVMTAHLHWLAPRIEQIRAGFTAEREQLRGEIVQQLGETVHGRTPDQIADLLLGWRYFLAFATDIGAMTKREAEDCLREAGGALLTVAKREAVARHDDTPVQRFLRGLSESLAAGRCHLAAPNGDQPTPPERWGWMAEGNTWRPCGERVGWSRSGEVWLLPEVAMRASGIQHAATVRGLGAMLRDAGLLLRADAGRHTLKTWAQEASRNTWVLAASLLVGRQLGQNTMETDQKEGF